LLRAMVFNHFRFGLLLLLYRFEAGDKEEGLLLKALKR
jgi:hypothetical protein